MTKIYGIWNCDTVRKAVKWLEANGVEHEFVDYRKTPNTMAELELWENGVGWEALLNKRSTAWKPLDDETKASVNRESALALMLEKETLIKRPVLVTGDAVHLGFKPEMYQTIFDC